jgi:hypothetical protein
MELGGTSSEVQDSTALSSLAELCAVRGAAAKRRPKADFVSLKVAREGRLPSLEDVAI